MYFDHGVTSQPRLRGRSSPTDAVFHVGSPGKKSPVGVYPGIVNKDYHNFYNVFDNKLMFYWYFIVFLY